MKNSNQDWFKSRLDQMEEKHLTRILTPRERVDGLFVSNEQSLEDFASNDYLGLSDHPAVLEAASSALGRWGSSASASRLVTGTLPSHVELEQQLAGWLGLESALVFGSGYHANVGLLQALASRRDHIFIDKLAHASLVDGSLLSRAKVNRFLHNDLDDLEQKLKLAAKNRTSDSKFIIVSESIFSMDGDSPDLVQLESLVASYQALLVLDEAHAIGVAGKRGAGLNSAISSDEETTIITGTFSKALASFGGFIACSKLIRRYLLSNSRSFIFSTALPPASVAAAGKAIELCQSDQVPSSSLLGRADFFRGQLKEYGFDTMQSTSHIVPVLTGDSQYTITLAEQMRGKGVLVGAMRTPSVPEKQGRLRFSLNLRHDRPKLKIVAEKLAIAARELNEVKL